jgi:NADH-quinone oxidoreductase subunit M
LVLATGSDRNASVASMIALVGALAAFLVTHSALHRLRREASAMQFVELPTWIPRFNINYTLGLMAFRCCSSS